PVDTRSVTVTLHHVERIAAQDDVALRPVVRRIQQILPMWWRMHQVVMSLFHSCSIRNVFPGPINMLRSSGCQSLLTRGLSGKLMRKLLLCSHSSGMFTRRLSQAFIPLQCWKTGCGSHLIVPCDE